MEQGKTMRRFDAYALPRRFVGWLRRRIGKFFDPAITVGDKRRARAPGEKDPDAELLLEKDRQWREMLKSYPPVEEREEGKEHLSWMDKLMTHVRPLRMFNFASFALFVILGLTLPAKHSALTWTLVTLMSTVVYWFWIGRWMYKIEMAAWKKFKEKYGKHWHLR